MNEKREDEIYCPACGKIIKKTAVFCVHCGTQIGKLLVKHETEMAMQSKISPKSKAVAITLAVFFGFWSWLYTYRRDQLKFWIFFGLWVMVVMLLISYSCSAIVEAIENPYATHKPSGILAESWGGYFYLDVPTCWLAVVAYPQY